MSGEDSVSQRLHNIESNDINSAQLDVEYILQYKKYFGFTKKINSQFVEFIGKK